MRVGSVNERGKILKKEVRLLENSFVAVKSVLNETECGFSLIKHRLNCDKAVFEQLWWTVSAHTSKATISWLKYNIEDYSIFHQEIGLQIRQICLRLKTFEALWLQLFTTAQLQTTTALKRGLRKSTRSISLTTAQNLIGSMPTQYTLSWSTAVVMLLRNFWMLQHYWVFNCCWAAICIIFSSSNFIDHTYQMI